MASFYSRVYGTSNDNADGSSRQRNIRKYCKVGDRLVLIAEPSNQFDRHAVGVWARSRFLFVRTGLHQIGYINAELSEEISGYINRGRRVVVKIAEITGGTKHKTSCGVNILIDK